MLAGLTRAWRKSRLKDPEYAFLFEDEHPDELVSIDCETTGLDPKTAQILSVGAIKIRGDTLLTSERLDFLIKPHDPVPLDTVLIHHIRPTDLENATPVDAAMDRILRFIGNRPLVGYFLKFDRAILDKYTRPKIGTSLPNRGIEVSGLYYDWRAMRLPAGSNIDLRFETIRKHLDLPDPAQHDAFNDALLTAMMYLRLKR